MRAIAIFSVLFEVSALAIGCGSADSAAPASETKAPAPTWRAARSLPEARFEGYAAVMGGKIWYVGGIVGHPDDLKSARESERVDVYDPATDAWTPAPSLPAGGPKHHLAVTVLDERIYVLGGFTGIIGGADVAGKFTPNPQTWVLEGGATGAWRRLADQPVVRGSSTAQNLGGKIYVVGGGLDEKGAYGDLLVYDPARDTWSAAAPMPTPREHAASCAVAGRMMVFGGWSGEDRKTVATGQSYDPARDQWTALPDMPTQRGGLGAASIGDVCYVMGGERWDRGLPGTFPAAEAFDAKLTAWRIAPDMPTRRHGIGVASLGAKIYVIGGGPTMGNSYTDVVEVLTP